MHKGYRILSIEGADIYKAEMENGAAVGVQLPGRSSDACFRLFKVFLDNSLDSAALETTYTRVCRKRFSFADKYGNGYTLAVVNVKFNYVYEPEGGKPVNLKALREHFYTNGFCVNGVHYVRYKRSAAMPQFSIIKWRRCCKAARVFGEFDGEDGHVVGQFTIFT